MDEALKKYYGFSTEPKVKKPKVKPSPTLVKNIKNHKLREINYACEKSISYSQLSTFLTCPHKWSLMYKDGHYTSQYSINMTFGTALHETLQNYLTVMYDKSGAEADRIDLEEYFETKFGEVYREEYKSNNNTHFSNSFEMREFFEDGINILNFIKKNRKQYFSKKGWHLVGCEIPILIHPTPTNPYILFKGYLDVVLYNELTNKFLILDIKTSTKGWNETAKKDENKIIQLILYKQFFSQQFSIPIDDIDIKFFIVKRKVWEEAEFAAAKKRVQEFKPASGKVKLNKATKMVNDFIDTVFNADGTHKKQEYEPNPSLNNCRFCPFSGKSDLCPKGIR